MLSQVNHFYRGTEYDNLYRFYHHRHLSQPTTRCSGAVQHPVYELEYRPQLKLKSQSYFLGCNLHRCFPLHVLLNPIHLH
ncbi:hypothetical protein FBHYGVHD_CDS0046 [Staphylococcus phage MVC_VPHSA1]|uniref:Uncharacterized protein n=1 Tax=Staphylococcus phage MVC_VPHSA1 TaxID=3088876 RepID=A0ABZ0QYL6_9CAUD|nr:hypothetical protein FBHYGVHD_CDS0046 [Staphylococcus phage MVC_VPHSA1]